MNNVYPAFTRREYPLYPEVCQRRISKPSSAPQNSSRRSQANEPHGRRAPAVGAQSQRVASQLEELTELESRLTILGHVQRACTRYVGEGNTGSMIGLREGEARPVDLEAVAGERKTVPLEHPWISAACDTGVELGD